MCDSNALGLGLLGNYYIFENLELNKKLCGILWVANVHLHFDLVVYSQTLLSI